MYLRYLFSNAMRKIIIINNFAIILLNLNVSRIFQ